MNSDRFIFKITISRASSLLFTVMGLILLYAGLDLKIFHIITNPEMFNLADNGYIFSVWFCISIGALVFVVSLKNAINPPTIFGASQKGILLKDRPFGSALTLLKWDDIKEISIHKSRTNDRTIISLKLTLDDNSTQPQNKITNAIIEWSNGNILIDSTYFIEEISKIIYLLKEIKTNPNNFPETDDDLHSVISKYC